MENVIRIFFPQAEHFKIKAIKSGKIHQSFLLSVSFPEAKKKNFLLQKINRNVFKDVGLLQENLVRISEFYNQQEKKPFLIAEIIRTSNGNLFTDDEQNNCWRIFSFLEGYSPLRSLASPKTARFAGFAFSSFILFFCNFSHKLPAVIFGFRNFPFYQDKFFRALHSAPIEKVKKASPLIKQTEELFLTINSLYRQLTANMPQRLLHNDPKISNLLLKKKSNALPAIVDLDTVNHGFIWQEFGDLLRSSIIGPTELKASLSLDFALIEALIEGFLNELAAILCSAELESLVFGPELISFELGLRFLTDYLEGGNYFYFSGEENKLQAASCQFLIQKIIKQNRKKIENIIRKILKSG